MISLLRLPALRIIQASMPKLVIYFIANTSSLFIWRRTSDHLKLLRVPYLTGATAPPISLDCRHAVYRKAVQSTACLILRAPVSHKQGHLGNPDRSVVGVTALDVLLDP